MIIISNETTWSREFISEVILLIYLSEIRKLIIPIITTYSSKPNNVIAKKYFLYVLLRPWTHGDLFDVSIIIFDP